MSEPRKNPNHDNDADLHILAYHMRECRDRYLAIERRLEIMCEQAESRFRRIEMAIWGAIMGILGIALTNLIGRIR